MSRSGLEQAIYWCTGDELMERGYSPDLHDILGWQTKVERLCLGFGHANGTSLEGQALFVHPFDADWIAVVQVANIAAPGLAFRLLLIPRFVYVNQIRDPFMVSDRFPPDWNAAGPLPRLDWPVGPAPRRRIDELQRILQTGNSPLLLGVIQALVDGARVVLPGDRPEPTLIRNVWSLLPESARAELRPATFAYSNALHFDVLISPTADSPEFDRYLRYEQVIDYPEGKYEFSLQYAIEHGDQAEVDRLFERRSTKQFLRFLIGLLLLTLLVYGGIQYLMDL